jgi:periplasmic copper chaperone A
MAPEERNKTMRRIALPLALACALLAPAAAQAHVSLHPNEVPVGSFATLDIRVPNEAENANTTKLAVQFPPGFIDVSTEYMPGWSAEVKTAKLAKPVQTDDGEVTEGVREIIWTGHGGEGKIPPGQFLNFPISTEIPGKEGEELTFKVLQYYDNGEVVRWIGPPDSEEPAPQVDVTAEGGVLQDVAGSETAPPSPAAEPAESGESSSGSGSGGASKGLGIAALVVGALGLLAGGAALVQSRRRA